jgi:hypothetical protein
MPYRKGDYFEMHQPPKAVGVYWIGGVGSGVGFHFPKKPCWWHRFMMRVALGWDWRDL